MTPLQIIGKYILYDYKSLASMCMFPTKCSQDCIFFEPVGHLRTNKNTIHVTGIFTYMNG